MQSESYRGYALWGHAIADQEDLLQAERFATSGTITRETKFIEAWGVLGVFDSDDDAVAAGLAWARAWIDSHG
ncbi:hypothetical protein [Paraburkholderia dilworthii]|uniref:hypothetical protein n=1 Tax=Paraburkholderia dilworthii TaxID=948106 RepID=UPI000423D1C0|nr:hypothetical protein [Paraburkholderia dilworthii]